MTSLNPYQVGKGMITVPFLIRVDNAEYSVSTAYSVSK